MEGLELSACPNYVPPDMGHKEETEMVRTAAETKQAKGELDKVVSLPDAGDLDPRSAAEITRAALTRLIIIAGEAESGKTTLLASIHQKLNEGPFAGYLFAGSQTLFGWERRCHLARIASGRSSPDTERTLGLKHTLLHLRVRRSDLSMPGQDILFTDISGELFRRVRDSGEECRRLSILRRADHFVLTLDGDKLSRSDVRQEAFHNGALILRSCCDEGMLTSNSFVDVLFTKYDLLKPKEDEDGSTRDFLEHIAQNLRDRFEKRVSRLRFFRVAARSDTGNLEEAYGLPDILPSWIEDTPFGSKITPDSTTLRGSLLIREFDKYLTKRLPTFVTQQ